MYIKAFLKTYAKHFTLAFILGAIVPVLVNPGSLKTDISTYEQNYKEAGLETTIVEFHLNMNEITNGYLERMDEVVQSGGEPNVAYDESCAESNLSTFCLASELNAELTGFEMTLRKHRQDFEFDSTASLSTLNLSDALEGSVTRQALIDDEITAARGALDLNLAIYDQIQTVYPIHAELVDLINNLESYRENLASIRGEVQLFPSRFNDATTTFCQ